MKKILSLILTLALLISFTMVCSAESVTYSFGTAENVEDADGSIIKKIPVYLTVAAKVSTAVLNIEFDSDSLTYIPYASASDKGAKRFALSDGEITEADDSVIGMFFAVQNAETQSVSFDNEILCYLRFKVKSGATAGNKIIKVTNSQLIFNGDNNETLKEFTFSATDGVININESEVEAAPAPEEPSETPEEEDGVIDEDIWEGDIPEDETPIPPENDRPSTTVPVEVVTKEVKFTDLENHSWAKEYIISLAQRGVINGTSETTFSPAAKITRADFMVLLMRLMKVNNNVTENFDDIPEGAYYAQAVGTAKMLGITNGIDGKNYNPTASISREDLCVLVVKAMEKLGHKDPVSDNGKFEQSFSDIDVISGYAKDAVKYLFLNGVINGSDGKFNPKGNATRAETAKIIYLISEMI